MTGSLTPPRPQDTLATSLGEEGTYVRTSIRKQEEQEERPVVWSGRRGMRNTTLPHNHARHFSMSSCIFLLGRVDDAWCGMPMQTLLSNVLLLLPSLADQLQSRAN